MKTSAAGRFFAKRVESLPQKDNEKVSRVKAKN